MTLPLGVTNTVLASFLLVLAVVVLLWMRNRKAGVFLAVYLSLVAANYLLDSVRAMSGWLPEAGRVAVMRYDTSLLTRVPVLLDPLALVLFAFAATGMRLSPRRVLAVGVPTLVVLAGTLLTVAPDAREFGWLNAPFFPAFLLEFVLYYALAFALLADRYLSETDAVERDRLGLLVVAIGIVVPSRLPLVYADLGFATWRGPPSSFPAPSILLIGGLGSIFALVCVAMLHRARPDDRAHVEGTLRLLGRMTALVALGWVFGLLPGVGWVAMDLLFAGRWFVFAGFFAVWIERHDFLRLPTAARTSVRRMLAFLASTLVIVELGYIDQKLQGAPWPTFLLYGIVAAVVAACVVAAFRLPLPQDTSRLSWQRLQVYRAQVELGASDAELETLRERLAVSAREAAEIHKLVAEEHALPARSQALLPGATILSRYDVGPLVGVGTFGRIHDATDRITGERVVLKELDPAWHANEEALERFRREAQTALRVDHPNLVAFRAFERLGSGHVLVLARVEGETLARRLDRGTLSSAEAGRVARDVLTGLTELHRLGIVHRDIKPENIMLRPDGRAVLLDFGCVTTMQPSHGTRATTALQPGTPRYMSPEQARGEAVTPASDVYAVGVVLWEALSGSLPPAGRPRVGWGDVLARALDEEPSRRWVGAADFGAAIPRERPISLGRAEKPDAFPRI